jgi:hypothetical protein
LRDLDASIAAAELVLEVDAGGGDRGGRAGARGRRRPAAAVAAAELVLEVDASGAVAPSSRGGGAELGDRGGRAGARGRRRPAAAVAAAELVLEVDASGAAAPSWCSGGGDRGGRAGARGRRQRLVLEVDAGGGGAELGGDLVDVAAAAIAAAGRSRRPSWCSRSTPAARRRRAGA